MSMYRLSVGQFSLDGVIDDGGLGVARVRTAFVDLWRVQVWGLNRAALSARLGTRVSGLCHRAAADQSRRPGPCRAAFVAVAAWPITVRDAMVGLFRPQIAP